MRAPREVNPAAGSCGLSMPAIIASRSSPPPWRNAFAVNAVPHFDGPGERPGLVGRKLQRNRNFSNRP
jgi:hypothetical protein